MTGEVIEKKTRKKKEPVASTGVVPPVETIAVGQRERRADGSFVVSTTHNLIVTSR